METIYGNLKRTGSLGAARLFLLLLISGMFSATANAQATLKLVGQLDPFPGDNRYADVWGEGNYAYLGSYSGTGVMILDLWLLLACRDLASSPRS